MPRYKRFTFLCTSAERQAIAELALLLQRSQADALRFIVMEATRQLAETNTYSATTVSPVQPSRLEKRVHDAR